MYIVPAMSEVNEKRHTVIQKLGPLGFHSTVQNNFNKSGNFENADTAHTCEQ